MFGTASAGGDLPFWLGARAYGLLDRGGANLGTRLHAARSVRAGAWTLTAGADLVARAAARSTLHAHQLYATVQRGPVRLTAGWKRRVTGLVDTTLSVGAMIRSGNAAPLPRLTLSTPGYVAVPGTRGYVAVQAMYGHAWFDDDRVVDASYLHEKSLFLRVLPDRFPVQGYAGLVHAATWAGTHPRFGDLPDGLGDYWLIVSNQASDAPDAEPSAAGEALGSSIGTYEFALEAEAAGIDARAYRQFFIETSAGAQLRNVWDGLWGVRLRFGDEQRLVESVLWEHLYTKRQSAQAFRGDPPFGTDKYYSNSVYPSGWVYRGRTIGTPLLFSDGENPGVDNNIVVAHHVGLTGTALGAAYRLLGTWSRNYGSRRVCRDPECRDGRGQIFDPPRTQWSLLAEAKRALPRLRGLTVRAAVAVDTGAVLGDRVGMQVGLAWRIHAPQHEE